MSFAIGAKRTRPLMTAAHAPGQAWVPAIGMEHTEIAIIDYLPGSWPRDAGIRCIARRTRIPVELIPTARARKRRTIPAGQLALALEGRIDAVYGYSFILTDLNLDDPADAPEDEHGLRLAEVEHWYRHRTDIEALNKGTKHGAALRHLPSANRAVNTVWMHAALLGCAIAAWMQELTGTDHGNGRGRFTVARFRREVIPTPPACSAKPGPSGCASPQAGTSWRSCCPACKRYPAPTADPRSLDYPPATPKDPRGRNLRPTPRKADTPHAHTRHGVPPRHAKPEITPRNPLLADLGLRSLATWGRHSPCLVHPTVGGVQGFFRTGSAGEGDRGQPIAAGEATLIVPSMICLVSASSSAASSGVKPAPPGSS